MSELWMSACCRLGMHYDCGEFSDGDECECPCHDDDLE